VHRGADAVPDVLLDDPEPVVDRVVDGRPDRGGARRAAEGGDPGPIRAAGRLSSGILALEPSWLQEWAEKAALS
jgi:hypothetical protein